MVKLDGATGEVLWSSGYANPFGLSESAHALAVDAEGNAFITGRGHVLLYRMDILTAKFAAADGRLMWLATRGAAGQWDDTAWDLELAADGHPLVTGRLATSDTTADFYTAKLDSADGGAIWERRLPGAVIEEREAGWLEILPDGDVVVCNRTAGEATGLDVVLHRYDGVDGTVVWTQRWGSAPGRDDDPLGMVLIADGDPLVFGASGDAGLLARFDAATGQPLWDRTAPALEGAGELRAAQANASGEVLAAGATADGPDAMLLVVDAADGAVRDAAVFDAGEGLAELGADLAADDGGRIFLTGTAATSTTAEDLLTLAYRLGTRTAVSNPPPPAVRLEAWPNPFNPAVDLRFQASRSGDVRLDVFDSRGRRVRTLLEGYRGAGPVRVRWDGRDAGGRPLPAGIYHARLAVGDERAVRKLVLAK